MPGQPKRACDQCHRRKVRCDSEKPCARCNLSDLRCTYDAIPQKKGPKGRRAEEKAIYESGNTEMIQSHYSLSASSAVSPYGLPSVSPPAFSMPLDVQNLVSPQMTHAVGFPVAPTQGSSSGKTPCPLATPHALVFPVDLRQEPSLGGTPIPWATSQALMFPVNPRQGLSSGGNPSPWALSQALAFPVDSRQGLSSGGTPTPWGTPYAAIDPRQGSSSGGTPTPWGTHYAPIDPRHESTSGETPGIMAAPQAPALPADPRQWSSSGETPDSWTTPHALMFSDGPKQELISILEDPHLHGVASESRVLEDFSIDPTHESASGSRRGEFRH